ncbi:MAG: hypothetical protein ACTHJ0_14090 [Flavipsychrobacter sp.]
MKKIVMLMAFVSMTLLAAAQQYLTIDIDSRSGCCPNVVGIRLLVADRTHCTASWYALPSASIPPCGTPTTFDAGSYCATCTDIVAAQVAISPGPSGPYIFILGDNSVPGPCTPPLGPYSSNYGGGGGTLGCQWEAGWQYACCASTTAVLSIIN